MDSKYTLEITIEARQDLGFIYQYIKQTSLSEKVATKSMNHILKQIRTLERFPKRNSLVKGYAQLRQLHVYTYAVLYLTYEKERSVVIQRIFSDYTDWANNME
ncbi:MAG TPA: type II toxin-antitoxin system RelE/ParE family toxin [Candidatus Dojkabacteria bacterium]|nr:type II toxin-antitoxin system RelE/ParE family toxin [Candidatus Dojkabacteria bacterium]